MDGGFYTRLEAAVDDVSNRHPPPALRHRPWALLKAASQSVSKFINAIDDAASFGLISSPARAGLDFFPSRKRTALAGPEDWST
jgi:hypothetical protein